MNDAWTMQKPRLEPLDPARWPAAVAAMRDQLPSHLNVYRTMAHNGHLLAAWAPLRKCIVADTPLTPRQLEVVTLRVAHNTRSPYEWQHHVLRAKAAGLSDAQINSVRSEGLADLPDQDQALIRAVDELHEQHGLTTATWNVLAQSFSHAQILSILATAGFYVLLAYVLNSCNVQMESCPAT